MLLIGVVAMLVLIRLVWPLRDIGVENLDLHSTVEGIWTWELSDGQFC